MIKDVTKTESVALAIHTAWDEMDTLAEELGSWLDKIPEDDQDGEQAEAIREVIEQIEQSPLEPDVSDSTAVLQVSFQEAEGTRLSRATRRDNCVARLRGVIKTLDTTASADVADSITWEDLKEFCQGAIAEWDQLEFPTLS